MQIASLVSFVSGLFMILSNNFWSVAFAIGFSSLSYNLESGTREALAYDSLKFAGQEEKYNKFASTEMMLYRITSSTATLCAGFTLWLGYRKAYAFDIVFSLIAIGIACSLNEVSVSRIVDFGDTLAEILRNARKEQLKNRMQYGELYHKNYYREVKDKNRVYYEFYHLDGTENVPGDYKEISFVCLRPDGSLELPSTLGIVCRKIAQKLDGFEGFHFQQLRHTYTSNLLANGAAPKDVQELLGHSDVSTTMNVYAHSTRKAKRESAKLLDKVAGND